MQGYFRYTVRMAVAGNFFSDYNNWQELREHFLKAASGHRRKGGCNEGK